jgi:phosphate starvation-inducible PhoH-like protein
LHERNIEFESSNPIEIFGPNNANIQIIQQYFSDLKIIARGGTIKAYGPGERLDRLEDKIELLVNYFLQFGKLEETDVERLMRQDVSYLENPKNGENDDVILYGINGEAIKGRTKNQRELVAAVDKNDMVFAIGPAGTGKTYTAVALAVRALKNKEVKKIILTRPAVEAGESLGFLPGDLKEKLDPYLQPLYDALRDVIPPHKLEGYLEKNIIQIAPLAFMRGRTLDHAFVILDEAQNTSLPQLKMFLTRMGSAAKFVITGDLTQIDLPPKVTSGLVRIPDILGRTRGISFVRLNEQDVIRHKLVKKIIEKFKKFENGDG